MMAVFTANRDKEVLPELGAKLGIVDIQYYRNVLSPLAKAPRATTGSVVLTATSHPSQGTIMSPLCHPGQKEEF